MSTARLIYSDDWRRLSWLLGRHIPPHFRRLLLRRYWPWCWDDVAQELARLREEGAPLSLHVLERAVKASSRAGPRI
jgi:hypothetical protein